MGHQDVASRHLFRYISLGPRSNSYSYSSRFKVSSSKPSSLQKFVDAVQAHPKLVKTAEVLHARFNYCYEENSKSRDVEAEQILLPSLSNMRKLRLVSFAPYISGPAFVSALHPDARPELVSSLSVQDGLLRLDGASFQKLKKLTLDLDGDRDREDAIPSTKLHLPSSLVELEFFSIDQRDVFLSLDQAVPNLNSLEIRERGMAVASLAPFFKTQGPFLTFLVLLGMDLEIGFEDEYFGEPPDWFDHYTRDEIHGEFNKLLPVIFLCPNLVSLEINDVHLPHLARVGHPTIEIITLRREGTLLQLSDMGFFGDFDEYDDCFAKVSMAIQEGIERSRLPQLKTIRYGSSYATWDSILKSQVYADYGPWGLERSLDGLGIEFVDGVGVKWTQSVAGEQ